MSDVQRMMEPPPTPALGPFTLVSAGSCHTSGVRAPLPSAAAIITMDRPRRRWNRVRIRQRRGSAHVRGEDGRLGCLLGL